MFTVALIQSNIISDNLDNNLRHYERLLAENIFKKTDLIVFPEVFNFGFSKNIVNKTLTEDGKSLAFLKEISLQYKCNVVATMPIFEHNVLYNRLLWINSTKIIAYYDKCHLFMGEEKYFGKGEDKTIVECNGYRFLPLICFDIRFPEWCRNSLVNNNFEYDCLILPTNFPSPREGELKVLACARAIENQSYVFVTNRIGTDGFGKEYSGGTFIANPHGHIEAELPLYEEGVLIHNCNINYLKILRKDFPVANYW